MATVRKSPETHPALAEASADAQRPPAPPRVKPPPPPPPPPPPEPDPRVSFSEVGEIALCGAAVGRIHRIAGRHEWMLELTEMCGRDAHGEILSSQDKAQARARELLADVEPNQVHPRERRPWRRRWWTVSDHPTLQ